MKYQLKHHYTDTVLFECDVPDEVQANGMETRYTLEKAVKEGADLRGADLLGDLKAKAEWAPMFRDYSAGRGVDGECPRRHPTTSELMFESLDYVGGPSIDDVLQIISAAAMGQDVQERAKELIRRMADTWADHNLDEVLS